MKTIIAFPHKPGAGGPGSFQRRFEEQLIIEGFEIGYLSDKNLTPSIIFIVGGTRKLWTLTKWKLKGVPIIYRLDGINWLHRVKKANQSNVSNFIKSEFINFMNKIIHGFIANHIVYQSEFVKKWWNKKGFVVKSKYDIIHNGVDLDKFNVKTDNTQFKRIVILEGLIDYSPYAIDLINELAEEFGDELEVYGGIHYTSERKKLKQIVNYKGKVKFEVIPKVYSNSIYVSLDVNPACPNTVIEALACGAPVVAYDTGAIIELISHDSGICVDYGSNPWKLDYPNTRGLIDAIKSIKRDYRNFSKSSRLYAEKNYSIKKITSQYIQILKQLNG